MDPLFLAKLLGIYLVLYGLIALLRRKALMPAIAEIAKNRGLLLVFASIELAVGLAIVLAYPMIGFSWLGIVSLVGWMMIVESVLYLTFPKKLMRSVIEMVNRPIWYQVGGILSILLGLYLAMVGFGIY